METGVKVKLKVDLTKYRDGLVVGSEGYTIGQYGMWSRSSDLFTGVDFPGIGKLDININSLEVIDKDYLKRMEVLRQQTLEEYKSAQNVVLTVGPLGGFKDLSFEYKTKDGYNSHIGIGFENEAYDIMEYFKILDIPVKTLTKERKK